MKNAMSSVQTATFTPSSPSSLRFNTTRTLGYASNAQGRSRTTSESIPETSLLFPERWKGKGKETTWTNDPDPFAASPNSYSTPSVRSASPVRQFSRRSASTTMASTPSLGLGTGIAGGGSVPPATKKQRASLLVSASDSLFSFGTRRRASLLRKPSPKPLALEPDGTLILDIRASPTEPSDEAEEREALRNAAARAVGLEVESRPMDEGMVVTEEDEEDEDLETVEGSPPTVSRNNSLRPFSPAYSMDTAPLASGISRTLANGQTAHSSAVSLGGDTNSQQVSYLKVPELPQFPCSLSSLVAFTQTSSTLLKHYPGGSFFRGRSKQWKSRHLVLTSLKPPPNYDRQDSDTLAHLHLFRNATGEEKEMERMRIDEDSVVFVTDEGAEVSGKKFVLKIGGLNAGGLSPKEKEKSRKTMTTTSTSSVGSASQTSTTRHDELFKIMWLLQCPDSATVQQWIGFVKTALLVQRAERAGLGTSVYSPPSELKLNGDLDVVLSLRAQGLLPSPTSASMTHDTSKQSSLNGGSSSPATTPAAWSSSHEEKDGPNKPQAPARARSLTNTSPSLAVNALKGLFTHSNHLGNSNRPRSLSSAQGSLPNSPPSGSPVGSSSLVVGGAVSADDLLEASLGNRASTLLGMSLRRATSPSLPSGSTSLLIAQPISTAMTTPEESVDMDFSRPTLSEWEGSPMKERESGSFVYASGERPTSPGSLPPPPRSKRVHSQGPPSRSPTLEQSLQDELKKAMFGGSKDMNGHGRRQSLSSEIIPEESYEPTAAEKQADQAREPMTNEGVEERTLFSLPESGPAPSAAHGPTSVSAFGRSTHSFGADFIQPRPPSVLSDDSVPTTPPPSHDTLLPHQASPSSIVNASPGQRSSSSGSRRIPMLMAPPPSGPLPSIPDPLQIGPPLPVDQRHVSREELTPNSSIGRDQASSRNGSGGTSFFNSKRVSNSSVAVSFQSFNSSVSSKSNSGRGGRAMSGGAGPSSSGNGIRASLHPPPRPTPTFAPPPAPSSSASAVPDHPHPFAAEPSAYSHPYAAESYYSPSTINRPLSTLSSGPSVRSESSFGNRSARLSNVPPPQPPPNGSLPPRPDEHVFHAYAPFGHHRSNSLSTPVPSTGHSSIPDSSNRRLKDLPHGGHSTSQASHHPFSFTKPSLQRMHSDSQQATAPKHTSLKARIRMLSTPSPRSSTQSLATNINYSRPDSSTPTGFTSNNASKEVPAADETLLQPSHDQRPRSNTFETITAPVDPPLLHSQPILPLGTAELASQLSLTLTPAGPPVPPPRSQHRPKAPLISQSAQQSVTRTLSPPPRRTGRHSRELSISPIPKLLEPEESGDGVCVATPSSEDEVPRTLENVSAVPSPSAEEPSPTFPTSASRSETPEKIQKESEDNVRDSAVAMLR